MCYIFNVVTCFSLKASSSSNIQENTYHCITVCKRKYLQCIYFLLCILYHWSEGDPLKLQHVAVLETFTYSSCVDSMLFVLL